MSLRRKRLKPSKHERSDSATARSMGDDGAANVDSRVGFSDVEHDDDALLVGRLAGLLRPFSPQIEFGDEDGFDAEGVSDDLREYYRQPTLHAPLVSVLAMQLYNHLAERADFRICGNGRCRRSFVTHQGRAQHGQHHRTGRVKYCSLHCARAQATRDHRRREAATKGDAT